MPQKPWNDDSVSEADGIFGGLHLFGSREMLHLRVSACRSAEDELLLAEAAPLPR